MSGSPAVFAAPLVTANVYCDGLIDELLHGAIGPFWLRRAAADAGERGALWFARASRGGEHLKIRLYGPAARRQALRRRLGAAVERFLAGLPPPAPSPAAAAERDPHSEQFPIDLEDECQVAYPDRTLLWTRFRRLPAILGRLPTADDPLHEELFTRCLTIGSELMLERFVAASGGRIAKSERLGLALKLFVAAVAALGLDAARRLDYLCYHRDWLLAVFDLEPATTVEKLDRHARAQGAALAALRPLLAPAAGDQAGRPLAADPWLCWQDGFTRLFARLLARAGGEDRLADGYWRDQVFAAPFKLLHAHTNMLALGPLDEASLCQLLVRACDEGSVSPSQGARDAIH